MNEKEWLDELEASERLEREIEDLSTQTAKNMVQYNRVVFEYQDRQWMAKYAFRDRKQILLAVADINKQKLATYSPFQVEADIKNELSLAENLKAVLEVWMKHVAGIETVEVLE